MSSSNMDFIGHPQTQVTSSSLLSYPLTKDSSFIDYLPWEVVLKIADHLQTVKNVNNFGLASRRLCILLSSPAVWNSLVRHHFPNSYAALEREVDSLAFYKKLSKIVRNMRAEKYCLQTFSGHLDGVFSVELYGDKLISGSRDTTIRIWDLKTGKLLHTMVGHSDWVHCVIVSGDKIISASADHKLMIWNSTGQRLQTLNGHQDTVSTVVTCGDMLISGSWDKTIKIWNLETGGEPRTIDAAQYKINKIAVYDGKIFSAARDSLKIWDLETGKELWRLYANLGSFLVCDGKLIFSHPSLGDRDCPIEIRDLKTHRKLKELNGHRGGVRGMAVYDGMLVSCGWDGVKIWELETEEMLLMLSEHKDLISVAFCNGKLVTGSRDNKIRIWDFNLPNSIEVDYIPNVIQKLASGRD